MSLHKLTAGDGYAYLTRQVAALDGTDRGYDSLGDYYAQKGASPGLWMGRGLTGLLESPVIGMAISAGGVVSEAQMVALFGQGRHPDAEAISAQMTAAGHGTDDVLAATQLGRPFAVYEAGTEFRRRVATALEFYNRMAGVPAAGRVPQQERARIRTEVAVGMFVQEYGRLPLDDRERSGFLARMSRQATTAVAGYDLTFSPVKSVSALWAIAPAPVSRMIEDAHRAAVADTVSWLEDAATYTRRGRAGVRQVDVTGLIAAAFEHRDSRAGDPDLHTHVAISNKVQALDGAWLALDGRPLHQMAVAASERYNTRLEAHLVQRLGVRFADRAGSDPGKRPVREIVGIPHALLSAWSARRAAIEERRAGLSAAFQSEHGRPPTPVEAIHLAQQATLETREAKHEPRSLGEQRATWSEQAVRVLGGSQEVGDMLSTVLATETNSSPAWISSTLSRWRASANPARQRPRPLTVFPNEKWLAATAGLVVQTIEAERATWRESHVRAEAERRARAAAIPLAMVDRAVDDVVRLALCAPHSICLERPEDLRAAGERVAEPAALRRRDGTSVYQTAGTALHTSARVLAAERDLLEMAARHDAATLSEQQIDVALLEHTANGAQLNAGQAQMVRDLARSGARVQLALAPAGTGKTTAMSVLARAWTGAGGTVVGLAPSAVAASVLREALPGAHTDTLAKLTYTLDGSPEIMVGDGARRARTSGERVLLPEWVRQIGEGTMVVTDEAGMAGTIELATTVKMLIEAGAVVRLIGDDQQLAAIGAGGVLRDLAHEHGAATLSDVVRFSDPIEGRASLALRAGDVTAIGFYLDMERIHVGDASSAADQAYTGWRADVAAGRDAILLAPTHELVAGLNARARADRLLAAKSLEPDQTASRPVQIERDVVLADGTNASPGDVIITRRNSRRLMITSTDWVKNGYRWRIDDVTTDGSLRVQHLDTRRRITLPADYVREHVTLGYATTIHAAQGLTADVCHVVASATNLTRQLLYVALSRGRSGNHLYLDVAGDGDEHSVITRDALLPPSAADELVRILSRDGAQTSATTIQRDLADPATCLLAAAARHHDAVLAGAEATLGTEYLTAIQATAEQMLPGLSGAPAWETLRGHLALLAVNGLDPAASLQEAITSRELDSADDPAAVLDWRLGFDGLGDRKAGPLPWLPAVPAALIANREWGPYLRARTRLAEDLAATVADAAGRWTVATSPTWALPVLRHTRLVQNLAVWRAAQGIADTELTPTGPRPPTAAENRYHAYLSAQVADVIGDPQAATSRWGPLVRDLVPEIINDAFWPQLAARLENLSQSGIDVATLLCAVTATARPIPDEHPASALWWRLTREVPPQLLATAGTSDAAEERGPQQSTSQDRSDAADSHAESARHQPKLVPAMTSSGGQPSSSPVRRPPLQARTAAFNPDVSLARIADLNAQALRFFTARYPHSWAPAYLNSRLNLAAPHHDQGTDRVFDSELSGFSPGYAPAGWTSLVEHLRAAGALDDELLAAGLATRASTGRLIDRFRDRLILPIYRPDPESGAVADGRIVVGFVGRRNPDPPPGHAGAGRERRDDGVDPTDRHGPKYLNTPATALFDKSQTLYGLTEAATALCDGATPVLVEGPLDAIAVTLAGAGRYVGLAFLGTAITAGHVDLLIAHQRDQPASLLSSDAGTRVLVATDADTAGQAAADKAYWLLAEQGVQAIGHVLLPTGTDPAQLLTDAGPQALRSALTSATPLADTLINDRIHTFADRLDTVEGRVFALRAAAEVVATQPPAMRAASIENLALRLDLMTQSVRREILIAVATWNDRNTTADPSTDRWAALFDTLCPGLSSDPEWPDLAAALSRADDSGYDVIDGLSRLADDPHALPLDPAARGLHSRLVRDCPAATPRRLAPIDHVVSKATLDPNRPKPPRRAQPKSSIQR